MSWIILVIAGLCEIGWPLGFKLSQTTGNKTMWISIAIISMALSGFLLYIAQKSIPIGTAYAVWTGIGAAGTFILGILIFKDPSSLLRILSVTLIIVGVIGLKLAN